MSYLLDTPAVIVDLDVVERNIERMVAGLQSAGIKHRPHIKAHKSVRLAKLQLEKGAQGITCAKLGEAETMIDGGITDILIANEIVGEIKVRRLIALNKRAQVFSCIDSIEGAQALSDASEAEGMKLPVLIEIDGGGHRCGRQPGEDIIAYAKAVSGLNGISVMGLLTYAGQIYGAKGETNMRAVAREEKRILVETARALADIGLPMLELSGGSSLSSPFPDELQGITESRAGNYIFNDVTSIFSGIVKPESCALRVVATIISLPVPGRAIIDAGTKTLTSDTSGYRGGYGYIVEYPGMEIYKLNEEHGYIKYDPSLRLTIGQQISIIPNHCCVLPNLCDELAVFRSGEFGFTTPVEARGKNK
jgi:D-serine deaminase-like pyridoxal phosphate-dependent protein